MNINDLQIKKEELSKKKELIVRAETKKEGLVKDKEKAVKKLQELGTDEKSVLKEIENNNKEIENLMKEYEELESTLNF